MSPRALALDWNLDGPVGVTFLVLLFALGVLYLLAAERGRRRDRRGRRWPANRTACFLAGLTVLAVDLYSGIGTEADLRLSVHMLEHMIIWLVVAPLLAAGAPVRLAFYALPREGRRTLGRWLHSRPVWVLTSPVGSVSLFAGVLLIAHLPAVYGLTLSNDYLHAVEHGLFLVSAVLVWAPVIGADPLPHRQTARGQLACMVACMIPMAIVAAWLSSASGSVYGHYVGLLGPSALSDQREAALIMWVGGLPAFAVPVLMRPRVSRQLVTSPLPSQGSRA
ncbi:MAG TPA: cytochrome c oxidase assembly protein [Solirubrobacteraceae bacterium]|nr:cytochrome c oxidase assembly protein [Solirubrobacteraceae bacterium]